MAPAHREALEALGLSGARLERLVVYLDGVERWARRVNLTGAAGPAERARVLVAPALAAAAALAPGALVDVGSGNGSPGLVLALLDPQRETTLLEPRLRRAAFLAEMARAAGLVRLRVLRARHDAYPGPPAPNVTVRALRLPLAELLPLLSPGGRLLLWREPGPLPACLAPAGRGQTPPPWVVERAAAACST